MNPIILDAFDDELEKISGVKRVQRIVDAINKKKNPLSSKFIKKHGLNKGLSKAFKSSMGKLDRRVQKYSKEVGDVGSDVGTTWKQNLQAGKPRVREPGLRHEGTTRFG